MRTTNDKANRLQLEQKKPNIIATRIRLKPNAVDDFAKWQSHLQDLLASFPGFLSLEVQAPIEERPDWLLVQRFIDADSASAWKQSQERRQLFGTLTSLCQQDVEEYSAEEQSLSGVTEVIVTEVSADKKGLYRKWLSKIHQAEAKAPGFRRMYVQSPNEKNGRYWITFLQFDTVEHLDRWLASDERKEILKELMPLIKSLETHRVMSSYAGWFGSIAKMGSIPPVWKQTMLVLLVLFPIVMMEMRYLNPHLKFLNVSLGTFIGNAISVSLISWVTMPVAIFFFRKWLNPEQWNYIKISTIGALVVLAFYLIEIAIFWNFF